MRIYAYIWMCIRIYVCIGVYMRLYLYMCVSRHESYCLPYNNRKKYQKSYLLRSWERSWAQKPKKMSLGDDLGSKHFKKWGPKSIQIDKNQPCGESFGQSLLFDPKWSPNGAKMELKWSPNRWKCDQKASAKIGPFPDIVFIWFLVIFELFLDWFFYIFRCFFQGFEKGPTCVSTAPWRVDWGSDVPKSNPKQLKNIPKSTSKTSTSTNAEKCRFVAIWGAIWEPKSEKNH